MSVRDRKRAAPVATAGNASYDAFISYGHAADGLLAPALQTALQSIGKPWYRRRVLRVFRDATSLSASPELWPAIERELERSRHFILLASPGAAASPWVDQEVAWWRSHRSTDTMQIVLTAGELEWDERTGDFTPASTVPPSARGWLLAEPLWVDLRTARDERDLSLRNPGFRDSAASLAAPIRGIDKDELVGEDIRQHKRTVRIARAAVVSLSLLTIAAITAGIIANGQRVRAERETRQATSLALASTSEPLLERQPETSLALAFESYETSPLGSAKGAALSALAAARDRGLLAIFHGNAARIMAVAFSPDGHTLASSDLGGDNAIWLWDARRRASHPARLTGHRDTVVDLAFASDGRTLASSGGDAVRVWDVRTRKQIGAPYVPRDDARAPDLIVGMALSADGRTLAVLSASNAVHLWDVRAHKQLAAALDVESEILGVAFAGRRTLAYLCEDDTIRLVDARTGTSRHAPIQSDGELSDTFAFSPDGRTLASVTGEDAIELLDAATGRRRGARLTGHTAQIVSLAFSRDGRRLASGGSDEKIRVWDARSGAAIGAPLTGHTGGVSSVAFGPDSRMLVSGSSDTTVRLWDRSSDRWLGMALGQDVGPVRSVAFSRDGRMLASAGNDGTIALADPRTGKSLGRPLAGHGDTIRSVAFSPDGRTLASAGDDDTIRLWDARGRSPIGAPLTLRANGATSIAFGPGGRLLASANGDGTIRVWDARTAKQLGNVMSNPIDSLTLEREPSLAVAFSPDGRTLAAHDGGAAIVLWDARTHKRLGNPLAGHDSVLSLAFSPDGRTLASGGSEGTIRMWDVHARKQLGVPFTGHSQAVSGVTFTPDGRTLVSAGADNSVRLWDVATRSQLGAPLNGHTGAVNAVAVSPDGRTLASGGQDAKVRLWPDLLWRSGDELKTMVCELAGGLSEAEWARAVPGLAYRNSCE